MIATESIIAQSSIARRCVGNLPPSIARPRAGNLHRSTDASLRSAIRFRSSVDRSLNKTLHQTHSVVTASRPKNQSNQQYSIIALTDSAGSIVERTTYTPYGAPTFLDASGTPLPPPASSLDNRITYTGREWDSTLHLHHFRARMMDPQLGRFCGRDPIGYVDGYNLYNLVHNGPLDSVDPHGLCEEKWIGSACIKCRVMVKGRTFGEYSAPGWGLPWNKSAFFTGDLHAVCSFVDQVQCCCPSKKVSVSFNFHLHLSFYDYRLYSWGTVIVHAARSIYLPMWANWIITAAMNKDLFGMFEDAMKADQRMKRVLGFSPENVCLAARLTGLSSLSGGASISVRGLTGDRPPHGMTSPGGPIAFSTTIYKCYNQQRRSRPSPTHPPAGPGIKY